MRSDSRAKARAVDLALLSRDIRPGSCRRREPGSTPPCGGSRAGDQLGLRPGADAHGARDKCSEQRGEFATYCSDADASNARFRPDSLEQRWVRKNPRSKAGSPAWAHSKSSRIRPRLVHQDVLGAEIAQDERALVVAAGPLRRSGHRSAVSGRMAPGDRPIVRVDPQLVEEAGVGQSPAQGRDASGPWRGSVPRMVPSRAAMAGSIWPAIKWDFQVTASSGAQVIAKR